MTTHRTVRVHLAISLFFAAVFTALAGESPGRSLTFSVTPAASGEQLVRTSLPFPRGFLATSQALLVAVGRKDQVAGLRVLSWYPATNAETPTARRGLVTFPYRFADLKPVVFTVKAAKGRREEAGRLPVSLSALRGDALRLRWSKDGTTMDLTPIAPARGSTELPRVEIVETNRFFLWERFHYSDPEWPRVVEARLDAEGAVALVAHVQRGNTNGNFAPDLGWVLSTTAGRVVLRSGQSETVAGDKPLEHSFAEGSDATCLLDDRLAVYHPAAPWKRRGGLEITPGANGPWTYRYRRCRAEDKVPMQPMSWQRAEIVIARPALARLTSSLSCPHRVEVEAPLWSALYGTREPMPALPPVLEALVRYHRDAIAHSAAAGDDFGNITSFGGSDHGPAFGMNRLNHGASIFEDGWQSNDRRLIETGVLWCDNFYDQTIWWGEPETGGTRYNNRAVSETPPTKDYMWRSDTSVNFCTKGYDCFWLAWEETGDPRMLEAFRAQVAYAAKHIHANQGECRNIGDVRDFVRLYEYTGEKGYLDEALRLFRELRTKLSPGQLFDQGGKPIDPDPPFIEDDQGGYHTGYAKPYIIGYALAGLPELIRFAQNEPDLKETVRAVADFLAGSVDPSGGWRYPHPRSSSVILGQAIEHAWQLTQAARAIGPDPKWLDAIESVLRARILGWQRTGLILGGLEGWESSTGKVKDRTEMYRLYRRPADRDASRDYREGRLGYGGAPPEGLVYFREVLAYYLQHRDSARLLAPPGPDEPLGLMLARSPEKKQ